MSLIRRRLLHGGIWALAARGMGIIGGLAVNALLARMLSPEDMGAYFLSLSVAAFVSTLGQLGLPVAIVRTVAESMGLGQTGRARSSIMWALVISGLFGGILVGVYALAAGTWVSTSFFYSAPMSHTTGWLALLCFVMIFQGVLAESFRGFHDIRLASIMGGVSTPLFSAMLFAILWIIQGHADLQQVLAFSAGAAALSAAISASLLMPRVRSFGDDNSHIAPRELLSIGWPLCVTGMAVLIAVQGDLWVVGAMLGDRDAAIYGATLRLLAMMTMFHGLVVAVTQSTVAELYAKGEKKQLQDVIQGSAFLACVVAGGMLLVFALFGRLILGLVFGGAYEAGYELLLILGFGQFVGMLFGPAGMVMMMSGYQQLMMWIILANTTLGILLALVLAPWYGLVGVAVAWGAASILQGWVTWLAVKKAAKMQCHASWRGISFEKKKVIA